MFHAGTALNDDGEIVTAGGRVLAVAATAPSIGEARERAYDNVARIRFEGAYWRTDIGQRELETAGR